MKLLVKIGLWGLLAGGTGSALYADPVGGWLSPNGVSGGTSATTAEVAEIGRADPAGHAGSTVALSLADLQAQVRRLHDQIRADARHIQHLQQIARKEKDIIKLNCVNDKLVQVKPQMNLADARQSELEGAKDTDRMMLFEGISQAAENIRRLREEADQCIGEPISRGGESSNSFTGPQVPDDPTKGFGDVLEPPVYASPFN